MNTHVTPPTPIYIRLPRPGFRCPYTGLSRTTLAELTRPCERNGYQPPVAAKEIRARNARRGIVLVPLNALLDHLACLKTDHKVIR
jgi:hypothetical protein